MTIRKEALEGVIRASWSHESTSIPDEWDAETAPERGQCVPTSLVVQDYLGGEIERVATFVGDAKETHYRNVVDGELIDFSRNQYPAAQEFTPAPIVGTTDFPTLREYMLSYPATEARYRILAQSVARLIDVDGEPTATPPRTDSL